jgi:hypothetical protein
MNYNGNRVLLGAIDLVRNMAYNHYTIIEGRREDILRLGPGRDTVIVNEGFAAHYRIRPGDSLILPTPNGAVRFGVMAICVSYASDAGSIWMDINTYKRHWGDRLADSFFVRVKGMTRSQVTGMVIMESMLLGAIGGIPGSAAGLLIGWINLEGLRRSDFRASVAYHIHYPSVVLALLLSIGFSALAGLYPARRAAKTNVVEALSYE